MSDINQAIADTIDVMKVGGRGVSLRKGKVYQVGTGTVRVQLGGVNVEQDILVHGSYTPAVNDVVWLLVQGSLMLCLGKFG